MGWGIERGDLDRQSASGRNARQQLRQEHVMIRQPLQSGVGKDYIIRIARSFGPAGYVSELPTPVRMRFRGSLQHLG
jgi:hypothetical protein